MAVGPGKYDDVCTLVMNATGAEGALVIVLGGSKGHGFSAQLPGPALVTVPDMLESMAAQIRADAGGKLTQTASQKVDRWDYLMKAYGNQGGPEDVLLQEISLQMESEPGFKQKSEAEQLTIIIDRALTETAKNG